MGWLYSTKGGIKMTREEHLIELNRCSRNNEPFDFFGKQVYIVGWECKNSPFHISTCFKLS